MFCRASSRRAPGIAALCVLALACGDGPAPTNGETEGKRLALALAEHSEKTSALLAPYRCARGRQERRLPNIPGLKSSIRGPVLEVALADKDPRSITIGYVGDARGTEAETRAAVRAHRDAFSEAGAQMIVSLGGLAETSEDLEQLYTDLLGDSEALLIAIPGDRESVPAHRAAIERLAKAGARVLDGSYYQLIRVGDVVLANMPGIAMTSNLVAEMDGCQHLEVDARKLLSEGIRPEDVLLVNSYAPIRADEIRAQDRGLGSIHVGELALVPLLQSERVAVAIHAMVAPDHVASAGKAQISSEALILATGSLDPLERTSEALLLTLRRDKLSWRRLQVD